ncbi:hypothetical protein [Pararhizobium sp.]|uniref:hypothetical protein n=1 Tax=Pararhizobium sp. TaxID=1977563 RepID=UPI002717837B|nr:hypothetical protein [Pararhizobium sp.]MDO9416394.1 hypothetical protein [Pararhizobium sp.]
MSSAEIGKVMALMERHGIAEFEYEDGPLQIFLAKSGGVVAPVAAAAVAKPKEGAVLRSPGIGRFHQAHPSADTAPTLPRRVRKGDIVAYLAVGPMLRPVLAEADCILRGLLTDDGALTGYGNPLFSL